MKDFPWTYDQFQRYEVLKLCLEFFFEGENNRILDVGGASPDRTGKSVWLPVKKIWGKSSYVVDLSYIKCQNYVQGDGTKLPFRDSSFEVVSALDVVEHISQSKRALFIQELCRVSSDMVVISSPFGDDKIEEAEALIYEQIKKLYRIDHQQLKEHKELGLPKIEEISSLLGSITGSGTEFSYGSLKSWLVLQSIKSCFYFKENVGKIHEILDRFIRDFCSSNEFQDPLYRHYWMFSKTRGREELEDGAGYVKQKLSRDSSSDIDLPALSDFNRNLVRIFYPESVSALIIASKKGHNLDKCLKHILTQKVYFDLEVSVWDTNNSPIVKRILNECYPAVRHFRSNSEDSLYQSLQKIIAQLKGQYVLLIAEDILLPAISVRTFYEHLSEADGPTLLVPQVTSRNGRVRVLFWTENPREKGRFRKRLKESDDFTPGKTRWLWSECLFFKKEALFATECNLLPLDGQELFLWGSEQKPIPFIYLDDFVVGKKIG